MSFYILKHIDFALTYCFMIFAQILLKISNETKNQQLESSSKFKNNYKEKVQSIY